MAKFEGVGVGGGTTGITNSVGSIRYDASIDTRGFRSDAREVDRIATDTGKSVGSNIEKGEKRSSDAFSRGGQSALSFAAKLTAILGAGKLVSDALGDLAGLQTARASFEVLTGSAEAASSAMRDIATYANTTPFEFSTVAQAGKTLLGFGITTQDLNKRIRQLGDVAGATGGEFQQIARVFGQINATGKLMAEDFNQLIDNGVSLGDVIAKELNIPVSELRANMEKGAITSEVFNRALDKATASGGKFFGGAAKLSETLSGRLSTLKDTFTGFVGAIVGVDFTTGVVQANGAFGKFSDTVKGLTDFLNGPGKLAYDDAARAIMGVYNSVASYLGPKFGELWRSIQDNLLPALNDLWHGVLEPLIPVIGTALVFAIGAVVDILTVVVSGFGYVYDKLKEGDPLWWGLITVLGVVSAALALSAGFTAFNAGMAVITTITIPAVMARFAALAAVISSPLIMPAILIGAAVASLIAVQQEAQRTIDVLDRVADAERGEAESYNDAHRKLLNLRNNGTPEQQARARAAGKRLGMPGFASGGFVTAGSPVIVGENRDGSLNRTSEMFIPSTSGHILNNSELMEAVGSSRGSSAPTVINLNMAGVMARSRSELRDIGKDIIESINEELRAKRQPEIGGGMLKGGIA